MNNKETYTIDINEALSDLLESIKVSTIVQFDSDDELLSCMGEILNTGTDIDVTMFRYKEKTEGYVGDKVNMKVPGILNKLSHEDVITFGRCNSKEDPYTKTTMEYFAGFTGHTQRFSLSSKDKILFLRNIYYPKLNIKEITNDDYSAIKIKNITDSTKKIIDKYNGEILMEFEE